MKPHYDKRFDNGSVSSEWQFALLAFLLPFIIGGALALLTYIFS